MRNLAQSGTPGAEGLSIQDVRDGMKELQITKGVLEGKEGFMGKGAKDAGSHKFWSTQPVTKLNTPDEEIKEGPLEPNKPKEEIRQEPYELHKDFKWVSMDLSNADQVKEVYELLTKHYVEDTQATFRFDYSSDFIEWALRPPGYVPDWHVGIRVVETNKLVAFISGIPMDVRIRNVTKRSTEINFLCVHKKLRSRRLAPLLIREVTRRTHLHGIFQAIYTAGVYLPTPVSRCQYYHRPINTRKLVDTGFSAVPRNMTLARLVLQNKLPEGTSIPGLREVEKRDLKQVSRLLRAYLARMDMAPLVSNREVEHALFAGRGKDVDGKRVGQVTWCYVVEDPTTHRITDFFSFYSLPSTAVKVTPHTTINAAYLYYYATNVAPSCSDLGDGLSKRLDELIGDALVVAAKNGFDVFNSLTHQDNPLFLESLRFGRGDGYLHYYLYNYAAKSIHGGIEPPGTPGRGSGVGVVML
ncbi:N-myristoyl transferase [Meredithblackwellia eburnea MCA 4105]